MGAQSQISSPVVAAELLLVGLAQLVPHVGDRVDDRNRALRLGLRHEFHEVGEGAALDDEELDPGVPEERQHVVAPGLGIEEGYGLPVAHATREADRHER